MKKFTLSTLLLLAITTYGQVQKFGDLQFFVGTGTDTSAFFIDFHEPYSTTSFGYGILHNGAIPVDSVLNLISGADLNVHFNKNQNQIDSAGFYRLNKSNLTAQKWILLKKTTSWSKGFNTNSSIAPGDWWALSYLDTTLALTPEIQESAMNPNSKVFGQTQFFVGQGKDTAYLIIDFLGTWERDAFQFGILFNDSISGDQMLLDLGQSDPNIQINYGGGFLSDVTYQNHTSVGGGNYWSTWNGPSLSGMLMNLGGSTMIYPREFFGVSYTDFAPARRPRVPQAGLPTQVGKNLVSYYLGSGQDTAYWVVDFKDGNTPLIFGYLYSGVKTMEDMLFDFDSQRGDVSLNISGGFLMDISFRNQSGLFGAPNYWGTWVSSNGANWEMNSGVADTLENGKWYGTSYMDFNPAISPYLASEAPLNLLVYQNQLNYKVYPNPVKDILRINNAGAGSFKIFDASGKHLKTGQFSQENTLINLNGLQKGVYFLRISGDNGVEIHKILKW